MNICNLPVELILMIASDLSMRDFTQLLLVDRAHQTKLSPILYAKLLPPPPADDESHAAQDHFTTKDVLQWAIQNGSLGTLEKIDAARPLQPPLLNRTTYIPMSIDGYSESEDHPGHLGSSPVLSLHLASLCGQSAIVHYLLQKGALVNATVADGVRPIHLAKTGEVVQILVAAGSQLDVARGRTPLLFSLSHHSDCTAVAAFLQSGVDANQAAEDGATPAQVAVDRGNVGALKVLLEAGVDASKSLSGGEHLLDRAVWFARMRFSNDIPPDPYTATAVVMINLLLDHGASPNLGYESFSTYTGGRKKGRVKKRHFTPPLFLAVMKALSADVVRVLLQRGADQHAAYTKDRHYLGRDPASNSGYAVAYAMTLNFVLRINPEFITKLFLLIEHGGDINAHIDHTIPLSYCLHQSGHRIFVATELIPDLLELGADTCYIDPDGNQPIHIATGEFYWNFQQFDPIECYTSLSRLLGRTMSLLIAKGANLKARSALGRTPLMLLCLQSAGIRTALLIKHLLQNSGIDLNVADFRGYTASHHVLGTSDESCFRLQMLLEHTDGALEINQRNVSDQTPLHLLLEMEDPKHYALGGETVSRRQHNPRRTLAMLLRAGADATLRTLSRSESFEALSARTLSTENSKILSAPDIDDKTCRGYTPLHLACVGRDPVAMVETMLRNGAGADINTTCGDLGLTPLMTVVARAALGEMTRNDLAKLVKLLIVAGADVGLRDAKGRTAFDIFIWAPCLDGVVPDMPMEKRTIQTYRRRPHPSQALSLASVLLSLSRFL
ncbi:ankyrin repeat-containing domain protein [Xylariomycetidae sp. FL2044]|nr:ankyrin repeat-containing domain protein [Xylariomycetidae sp. FL2044]